MANATAKAAPEEGPVLQVRDLRRAYEEGGRRRVVLDGIDARVERGEIVALLGRSGSGKSTLLNLLAGIDRPDGGEIRVEGQRLDRMGERERTLFRRRRVGFIYQFFNLVPTLTVAENIALPLELNDVPARERRSRVEDLLGQVGLPGRGGAFPDALSGGEQQRVAIARAIAHEPALLLADEPTGNLDADTGARIIALLRDLARRQGRTLVMVTHSREVAAVADRVWTLCEGRLDHGDVHP
ncbi:ABC transporter ATP-binding protein [Ectothiorhodospira mobilis]|jgi:putative ABC transport system ATP-binding protein|uniref:Putative ABC transport system ATP-binding protein n=1 Tax=Ectothiorhodospira mobilis TaxID=195064 RepID=A0A1I4PS52_ECTMO|nr:ABC transporter ATP-binding protein [Ectothiorhodospira mobilis]MCG5536083.1 ABC transporter ATP-binding protein [Ectothiorhodospira mobilis]SFM30598.1 putative ABC transport system ATP-binding protein [Ectothiorhodospira mobilis]